MAEKPILFNSEMVRAILDGRKTQTRRVIKPQPVISKNGWADWGWGSVGGQKSGRPKNCLWHAEAWQTKAGTAPIDDYCPYGRPGDLLWVRETWATVKSYDHLKPSLIPKGDRRWPAVWYMEPREAAASIPLNRLSDNQFLGKNRPSIFMPRWASRITLRVTAVRVERVQEITGADVLSEGVNSHVHPTAEYFERAQRDAFVSLWDSINAKRGYGWDRNPWVWAVTFELVD